LHAALRRIAPGNTITAANERPAWPQKNTSKCINFGSGFSVDGNLDRATWLAQLILY
jgi:hypothetical protein